MDFGAHLKAALEMKKIQQKALAKRLDISTVYVNKLCNGLKTPSLDLLERICDALGFTLSEFFSCGEDGASMRLGKSEVEMLLDFRGLPGYEQRAVAELIFALQRKRGAVRVLRPAQRTRDVEGFAAAGAPLFDAVSDESVPVPEKYVDSERYYIVKARGVSMEPRIPEGSYAVVQTDVRPEQGQLALVGVEGAGDNPEYLIKEVHYLPGGGVELRSYNPDFPPKRYALSDVRSIEKIERVIRPQEPDKDE